METTQSRIYLHCLSRYTDLEKISGRWTGSLPLLENFQASAARNWALNPDIAKFIRTADWFYKRYVVQTARSFSKNLCDLVKLSSVAIDCFTEKWLSETPEPTVQEMNWFKANQIWPRGHVPATSRVCCRRVMDSVSTTCPWPYEDSVLQAWDPLFELNRAQIMELQSHEVTRLLSIINEKEFQNKLVAVNE